MLSLATNLLETVDLQSSSTSAKAFIRSFLALCIADSREVSEVFLEYAVHVVGGRLNSRVPLDDIFIEQDDSNCRAPTGECPSVQLLEGGCRLCV